MIIVKLMGGLGNQMFQYAAAKALALNHNVNVLVDTSYLNSDTKGQYTQRKFELDIFTEKIIIAEKNYLKNFEKVKKSRFYREMQRRFPALFKYLYAVESGSKYMESFNKFPANTYLEGFWQSEKYFSNYSNEIRSVFNFVNKIPNELKPLLNQIKSNNSVSLHIRRGDYVALKSANDFHGLPTIEYYKTALNNISQKTGTVELFVFSDDISWCKKNINFSTNTHFVNHNFEAYWDMFLMSQCKNNIIANSSFSWWAAWLNANTGKMVIMPQYWFKNIKSTDIDIVANNWLVV